MAEARSVAHITDHPPQRKGVDLNVDESGVHVRLAFHIPGPRLCRRLAVKRAHRVRRACVNSFYPLGPVVVMAAAVALAMTVASLDSSSWFRSGWYASFLWDVGMALPWAATCQLTCKVAVLAAWTGVLLTAIVVFFQRRLLRTLLSYQPWMHAPRGKRPLSLMLWAGAVKMLSGRRPLLYSFQSSLPTLPLPRAEDTVARYLASVQPLQTAEQFAETSKAAAAFLAGEGKTLQRYLRLKWWTSSNYVSDWWIKYCYHHGRDPIAINSNYYCLDAAFHRPTHLQTSRAAGVLTEILKFKQVLEREEMPPTMAQKLIPLCMEQYKQTFSTTRVPGRECDEIRHWDPEDSRHIVVLRRGYWYRLDVYRWDGSQVDPVTLEALLDAIKDDADGREPLEQDAPERAVCTLTAWNRTRWAEVREEHLQDGSSGVALESIESAILVLCLDDARPSTLEEQGRLCMHGDGCTDRWFDKSICMVVFDNGRVGFNCEHSWADAPTIGHMDEWCVMTGEGMRESYYEASGRIRPELRAPDAGSGGSLVPTSPGRDGGRSRIESAGTSKAASSGAGAGTRTAAVRLRWDLDAAARAAIAEARVAARALAQDLDLGVMCFGKQVPELHGDDGAPEFGKGFIKQCRVSPDAFVQMALQLAYYRDQGKFTSTYESSMTRLFKGGRTETIRTVSEESCAFVRAMERPAKDRDADEVRKLLIAASTRHGDKTKDAMAGRGCDRHLFALYIVAAGKGMTSPFLKSALGEPWRLSTSQTPQNQTDRWDLAKPEHEHYLCSGGGFGPVADDGYGVSYTIAGDLRLFFHVSSKHSSKNTSTPRFVRQIRQALLDMRAVLGPAAGDDAAATGRAAQGAKEATAGSAARTGKANGKASGAAASSTEEAAAATGGDGAGARKRGGAKPKRR